MRKVELTFEGDKVTATYHVDGHVVGQVQYSHEDFYEGDVFMIDLEDFHTDGNVPTQQPAG